MRALSLVLAAAFVVPVPGAPVLEPPVPVPSQATIQADGVASDPAAEKLMQQMVDALGGPRWLALHVIQQQGRNAAFYQSRPSGAIGDFRLWRTVPTSPTDPGLTRTEFSKQHDVVNILTGDTDWEITYKGVRRLPPTEYGSVFLRRDHSLDEAARVWWHQPGTALFANGQKTVDRHLVEEITLLSATNDNITLDIDVDSHLPFRVAFTWRDPVYKDKNEDATEYEDYHLVQGFQTPMNITTYHNGDLDAELYLTKVAYDPPLPPGAFDIDATAAKIVKK